MAAINDSLNDFQKIIEILTTILNKVNAETDVAWTQFNTPQELVDELTNDIRKLRACDYETLENVYLMFLPTGSLQELSISNGWEDEYLKLADQFDTCYEKLKIR
jgi:hypothetical protein